MTYLVNTGQLAEMDRWFAFANNVAGLFGTIDWVDPSNKCILVSSPTLTNKEGYGSDGSTSYIRSGYSPATQGVKYTLNSSCVGGYIKTSASIAAGVSSVICGLNSGSNHIFLGKNGSNASRLGARINSGPTPDVVFDVLTNYENNTLYTGLRTASNNLQAVKNGTVLATDSVTAPTSIPTGEMDILARNASGTHNLFLGVGNTLSAWFAGSGAVNPATVNTAIQNYMTALATI
jgi:hypothetical protein